MVPEQKKYSQKLKEGNRVLVLSLLRDGPKRFRDLQKATGLSSMGLYKILNELESKDKPLDAKITKKQVDKWPVYELTKHGAAMFSQVYSIGLVMDKIQDDGGHYFHDYSTVKRAMAQWSLPWGIQDDYVLDRKLERLNPINESFVGFIQFSIYKELARLVKEKLLPVDEREDGQIVLGFIIDYKDLIKSIKEKSWEKYQQYLKQDRYFRRKKDKLEKASDAFKEFEKI